MKHLLTIAFLCFCFTGINAQQTCATAVAVTPGIYDVTLAEESQVPTPLCTQGSNNPTSRGAWYTYTPEVTVTATVSTLIPGYTEHDTRVHIYSGTCDNLLCVGGDDDSGGAPGYTSIASFTAVGGTTYYIAFDNNWNSDNFSFNLTEAEYVPPLFTDQFITLDGYRKWCIVDLNGDYLDDIVASGNGFVNVLYQNNGTPGFTAATLTSPTINNMTDWSMAAGDYDSNGFNDLLYGSGGGASLLLANDTGTAYTTVLNTPISIFSQRSNFVDVNNDGKLDAFVCHDLAPNVCFINDGNSGFTFQQGGLGDWPSGGNYGSIWIDYDNDGDSDLFIAKCRGGGDQAALDELHRNNGDGTFTNVAVAAGLSDLHQSWSGAWGDYDNDGDMDVMIGNSAGAFGSADPNDPLNAHKLMLNNGDGTFSNITAGSGYDTFTTPSLVHVAHDFNNDGFIDIFGGGHSIMYNNGDMTFSPKIIPADSGPIGDLNNDGFLDIQNDNHIYFNTPNDNHWIKIELEGTESNRNGIGARVEVHAAGAAWGDTQIRDVKSGDGFWYMSSLNTYFGLGAVDAIDSVVIKWPSGVIDTIISPAVDQSLHIVEGSNVLSTALNSTSAFTIYPNPAKDVLTINTTASFEPVKARIYTIDGKVAWSGSITGSKISIQQLQKGTYILTLQDIQGKQHSTKFIKG
ncbi:FG-GAP-like repeat-containing protein [Flavobacterium sp. RHBU_24]|uniref:FG-GAP-like repeat-containing protein n=1 Tax=Flavobacterium sp. RHBU_24 TaxID=3391185 RepID=UPI00398517F4